VQDSKSPPLVPIMPDVIVKPVSTRRERKLFLELPWKMYRDDPHWIPPLRDAQKELVGYRRHPFYERNRVQTFLATRDGEVCGRIAAILNQDHNEYHNERRGFFGFFESIDDQEVATALFDAVTRWFAEQGIHCLRGPANPSQNYELGLLVDGFDSPPTFMMTYNPTYYGQLIEACGFSKAQDMYAYWGSSEMLPAVQKKLDPIAKQIIERFDVKLRTLDTSRFREDVAAFLSIFNRSLTAMWGFVPIPEKELEHMAAGLRHLIVPELAIVAEIDGKMVGVALSLPDYNPRIKQIDGRLFPFGFLRLLRNKQEIKKVRMISTNVVPEFQLMGIGLLLMHSIAPLVMQWEIEEAEFSWVMESNSLSRGSLEKGGAKLTKTYRLYDRDDPQPAEAILTRDRLDAKEHRLAISSPTEPLVIRQVQGRGDLNRFVRMPKQIYTDDPHWVAPLEVDVKEFLNPRKHPFLLHGEAVQFLAMRGKTPLGRILVSDDPHYNRQYGQSVGCFGMFESVDDTEVAHGLLEAASDWLRGRGRDTIVGPIDYSMNYACGLLVDGFDTPPRVMMNHNRRYYAELLESWGLSKAKDLYCWWFTDSNEMLNKWRHRVERIARRSRVTIRPFRRNDFDEEVRRCREVYNEALREHWGFVELTKAEFQYAAKRFMSITPPDLALIAEVDDRMVGFAVSVLDLNEIVRPLGGRLTNCGLPINLARFLYRKPRVKVARVMVLDLLKEYRRRGIAELLILKTLDFGVNAMKFTGAELGWTLEDNDAVNHTIEAVGGRRYKTYRIYDKRLSPASPA